MQRSLAALCILLLLLPSGGRAADPRRDAKRITLLEYSRNLAAHYPRALEQRIQQMQRRAAVDLSPAELCRQALAQLAADLEENPNRRIALVGAEPLGRAPDGWEGAALQALQRHDATAHHAFVQSDAGEVFRYLGRLDRLPAPCDRVPVRDAHPAAVSILRRTGPATGGAAPSGGGRDLPLPPPTRQGPRR